jgi:thiol:disulfide interchange protein DsbD
LRPVFTKLGAHMLPHTLAVASILVVLGILVGGLSLSFKYSSFGEKLRKAVGVLLLVIGAWQLVVYFITPRETHLVWSREPEAAVAAAKAAHRPALMDFYADWCIPCKELDIKVFSDPAVAAEMERFQLVKVDNTKDEDPAVVARIERYQAKTFPTIVLIDSSGAVVERVHTVPQPAELLAILKRIH